MSEFRAIAGHAFDLNGICQSGTCGIRWHNIRDADETCLDATGYAHVGKLNSDELGQIKRARADEIAACDRATRAVCGVSGVEDAA